MWFRTAQWGAALRVRRQDECVRVKRYGTRILTLDQIEGIKVRQALFT